MFRIVILLSLLTQFLVSHLSASTATANLDVVESPTSAFEVSRLIVDEGIGNAAIRILVNGHHHGGLISLSINPVGEGECGGTDPDLECYVGSQSIAPDQVVVEFFVPIYDDGDRETWLDEYMVSYAITNDDPDIINVEPIELSLLIRDDDNLYPYVDEDFYTVTAGQTLDVSEPGVLGNDYDLDPVPVNPLTVSSAKDPEHGNLIWYANGRIIYTPDPGFVGMDSFTYIVQDFFGAPSESSTVIITVVPNYVYLPAIFNP